MLTTKIFTIIDLLLIMKRHSQVKNSVMQVFSIKILGLNIDYKNLVLKKNLWSVEQIINKHFLKNLCSFLGTCAGLEKIKVYSVLF